MTDQSVTLEVLHAEILEMRAELRAVHELLVSVLPTAATAPAPRERADDLVGAEYVARLFGCEVSSVRSGKAGTKAIAWVKRRPLRARRSDVHAAHRAYTSKASTPRERTLKLLDRRKRRRKTSTL
jgi:hypothetical protein